MGGGSRKRRGRNIRRIRDQEEGERGKVLPCLSDFDGSSGITAVRLCNGNDCRGKLLISRYVEMFGDLSVSVFLFDQRKSQGGR